MARLSECFESHVGSPDSACFRTVVCCATKPDGSLSVSLFFSRSFEETGLATCPARARVEGVPSPMLRPKPGAPRPVDPIDRKLVEGVAAELPWHVLIQSAPCAAAEAEQRLLRLWRGRLLTGTPGALRPSRTRLAAVQAQPGSVAADDPAHAPQAAPGERLSRSVQTVPVDGQTLLRELRAMRGGTSQPAPESVQIRSHAPDATRQGAPPGEVRPLGDSSVAVLRVPDTLSSDAEAAMRTAKCLLDAGDLKQAAYYARRAAQLAPNNVSAHRVLLRFFQRSGMTASAQREREILRKLTGA